VGPITALSIYLVAWWVVFLAVLPFGSQSYHEAGIAPPEGCDPGAPVTLNMRKKVITTTWIAAVAFGIFWIVVQFNLITLPGAAQVY
jgi:predicted secreted protein